MNGIFGWNLIAAIIATVVVVLLIVAALTYRHFARKYKPDPDKKNSLRNPRE